MLQKSYFGIEGNLLQKQVFFSWCALKYLYLSTEKARYWNADEQAMTSRVLRDNISVYLENHRMVEAGRDS